VVIALAAGNWTAGSANPINDVTGLAARSQNILIRPVTIGAVTCGQWRVHASSITIAHMVGGSWYSDAPKNFCAWNNVLAADMQSTVNVGDTYELVGNVKPNIGTADTDCMQIHSTNGLIRRNWIAGKNRATTGHVDGMQITGHSGYLKIQNHFQGGGGSGQNSAIFFKEDSQSGAPQPQIEIVDTYIGHANNDLYLELDGGGQTITLTNVMSQFSIRLRLRSGSQAWDPAFVPMTVSGCQAQQYSYLSSTGTKISSNPTSGVTIVPSPGPALPTFTPPTWWDHAWDTI
jgi:hypothetical protein